MFILYKTIIKLFNSRRVVGVNVETWVWFLVFVFIKATMSSKYNVYSHRL